MFLYSNLYLGFGTQNLALQGTDSFQLSLVPIILASCCPLPSSLHRSFILFLLAVFVAICFLQEWVASLLLNPPPSLMGHELRDQYQAENWFRTKCHWDLNVWMRSVLLSKYFCINFHYPVREFMSNYVALGQRVCVQDSSWYFTERLKWKLNCF